MTLAEIQKYYSDLLISQYRMKPKAIAHVQAMVKEFSCDDLVRIEGACFNLDTAIGAQLDILGRIVGVPRNIYGLDLTHVFWETTTYSGSPAGVDMQRYADSVGGPEVFLRYRSTGTYVMTDFEMRSLLKMKILFNTAAMTLKAVKDGLYKIFAGDIDVTDNVNMTISYNVKQPYYNMMIVAAYIGIIPRSMGVSVTVNNI